MNNHKLRSYLGIVIGALALSIGFGIFIFAVIFSQCFNYSRNTFCSGGPSAALLLGPPFIFFVVLIIIRIRKIKEV
jgi:hypothetical protein